jgi:hypothetical protein
MKKFIAMVTFAMILASYRGASHEGQTQIVLPNAKLLLCRSSSCDQLWQDPPHANGIYPRQVLIDIFGDRSCPRGIAAIYEKSVPVDDIKAALDQRYGRWAQKGNANLPVKLWRVEPEKFAIQLAVTDDRTQNSKSDEVGAQAIGKVIGNLYEHQQRSNVAEAGMKQVIYLAFAEEKCGGM